MIPLLSVFDVKCYKNLLPCCRRLARGSGKREVRTDWKSESWNAKWIWHLTLSAVINCSLSERYEDEEGLKKGSLWSHREGCFLSLSLTQNIF